jgi:hypothetical protein
MKAWPKINVCEVATQSPTQWVPLAVSPGVELPEREDDYSSSSNAKFKNAWRYAFYSPSHHGMVLS